MLARRVPLVVFGVAGLLLALSLWLLRTSPSSEAAREAEARRADASTSDATAAPRPVPTLAVDAYRLHEGSEGNLVDVAGLLEPVRAVEIGAEVPGRVVSIETREHQHVEAGDVLVELDRALPTAAVERARAALLRAEAADGLAQSELRRQRDLADRGVTSTAELDRAESEARSSRAAVAEARANLIDAQTRLAKTRIEAPFAGFVSDLELEPGAYVQPGQKIAELSDLSEIEIEVGVSDQQILALADGQPVEVRVQVLPRERFEGHIVRLGRTPNARTRKYPVPVRVPNPDARLLPGMLGTVSFDLGDERGSIRAPRRALVREFDLDYVFVLEPRGDDAEGVAVARRRRVEARSVPFRPDLVEIVAGAEPGEAVAITGVRELRDGREVRIRETLDPGFESTTAGAPESEPADSTAVRAGGADS